VTAPVSNTPNGIVNDAMLDAGMLQEGDLPSSEQYAMYSRRLNDLINLWQTQGLKLWLQTDQSIALVAGSQTYLLGPGGTTTTTKPMRVLQGYYLDSSNVRRPIYPLSWDEWLRLSQVSLTGAISQYFVDKRQSNLAVHFWLIPDANAATGTAHLLIQRQVTNFTEVDETMEFPQEWRMALRWGLADDICTGQPQAIMDRCAAKATVFRQMLEDWDVEDASTSFHPDQRFGAYTSGAFR
jgi:hypothetical protein